MHLERVVGWIDSAPLRHLTLATGVLALAVMAADWGLGRDISSSFFYVIPVGVASWRGGRLVAVVGSAIAAGAWLLLDIAGPIRYSGFTSICTIGGEPFTRDERTQMWAAINLTINLLAIGTAMFATGRIATRFGLATTLALVPIAVAIGFLVVAVNPVLAVITVTWVVLKAGNYSITRPGREMLYTLVSREERFKAKPVIDIVVYRGGDTIAGWSFTGLTMGLGLGMGGVAIVGALIAVAWAAVGVYLGRKYEHGLEANNKEMTVGTS